MRDTKQTFPFDGLSASEMRQLEHLLKDIKKHPKALEMQTFIQHGTLTTYDHVVRVAAMSYWLNKRLHLKANQKVLIHGAFLHDFYLYDWHEEDDGSHKLHGFHHPRIASENAIKYFQVSELERDMILTHMWPLIPQRLPKSKEAWILCLADKICALEETIFER